MNQFTFDLDMEAQAAAAFDICAVVGDKSVSKKSLSQPIRSGRSPGCECPNGSNWEDAMSRKTLFIASMFAGLAFSTHGFTAEEKYETLTAPIC